MRPLRVVFLDENTFLEFADIPFVLYSCFWIAVREFTSAEIFLSLFPSHSVSTNNAYHHVIVEML